MTASKHHAERDADSVPVVDRAELDDAVRGVGLAPQFQPIVDLDSGAAVGLEALARWPGLGGAGPNEVFAHAESLGQTERLDHRCANAAIAAALDAQLPPDTLISVNFEPQSNYPGSLDPALIARARTDLTLAFELTERSMLTHPHTLLSTVVAMRADGFLIALDDVGAHPDSLALLDVLRPDIVKLDMGLVQRQPQSIQARAIAAVLAYHERTATPILAEGIENDTHLEHACALGASLGQGFKYGRPGPINAPAPRPARWTTAADGGHQTVDAPFDLARRSTVRARVARKHVLTALSRHVEAQANCSADPPIVLAALQHEQQFTSDTRHRYTELAQYCPLVALFGEDLPTHLGSGVRGVALRPDDPLRAEWTVVALGPQLAVALIARERPTASEVADRDRRFDFILTYERGLVTDAAHSLLRRMV